MGGRIGNGRAGFVGGREAKAGVDVLAGIEDQAHPVEQLLGKGRIVLHLCTKLLQCRIHVNALTLHTRCVGLIADVIALTAVDLRLGAIKLHGRPLDHRGIVMGEVILDGHRYAAQQVIEPSDASNVHGHVHVDLSAVILLGNTKQVFHRPNGIAVVHFLGITVCMGQADLQPAFTVVGTGLAVEFDLGNGITVKLQLTDFFCIVIDNQEQHEVRLAAPDEALLGHIQFAFVLVVITEQQHRRQAVGRAALIGHAFVLPRWHEGKNKLVFCTGAHPRHQQERCCQQTKNSMKHPKQLHLMIGIRQIVLYYKKPDCVNLRDTPDKKVYN